MLKMLPRFLEIQLNLKKYDLLKVKTAYNVERREQHHRHPLALRLPYNTRNKSYKLLQT